MHCTRCVKKGGTVEDRTSAAEIRDAGVRAGGRREPRPEQEQGCVVEPRWPGPEDPRCALSPGHRERVTLLIW